MVSQESTASGVSATSSDQASRPAAPRIALATIGTAWPAAGYGALVIWAAGDVAGTGTLWVFGWPFVALLVAATALHLLAVGAGSRWGISALVDGIDAFDRVPDRDGEVASRGAPGLPTALEAAVRFPLRNAVVGLGGGLWVTVMVAVLEWQAAGGTPNTWVILRGGLYATTLYAVANVALGELLTRPVCRTLRQAAAAADLDPYAGFSLGHGWRIAGMAMPTIVALVVAAEIALWVSDPRLAHAALLGLSAAVVVALTWLHCANARAAVHELRDACRALAAGRDARLLTGSIDPALVEMAREFTAAAARVGADRRDSGERYRAVVETALDCIVTMDHAGRIVEFNPAAEQVFGFARAQVVGRSLAETIVPPSLRAAHDTGVARHLATGEMRMLGRRVEMRAVRADGSEFPAEIAITRTEHDGLPTFTAHLRDITVRRHAEEALSASKREAETQAEIAAALLRVGEGISAHLGRADLLDVVATHTLEVLGCDATSIFVYDSTCGGFVLRGNAGSRPAVVAEIERVVFTAERFPLVASLRPGELLEVPELARSLFPAALAARWRIASLLAAPIVRGDAIVGLIAATYRERSGPFSARQHRLARGVAQATAIALENARLIADLQAANRLKTEFVSTMSHELRTPLNVILGFCEMAHDPGFGPLERTGFLARIEAASRTLLELVESTLEAGRLEAGRDDAALEAVAFASCWDTLAAEYVGMPRNPGVVLEWCSGPPDVIVRTDPRKVAIIVRNLVGNALKFTDRGVVRVETEVVGDDLVIRVSDTGVGIAPAQHETVFEMFRQADGSDSRRHEGTGLGLYIVRRLVEQLGGAVTLDSMPGRGSTFTLRLRGAVEVPVAPADPYATPRLSASIRSSSGGCDKKSRAKPRPTPPLMPKAAI